MYSRTAIFFIFLAVIGSLVFLLLPGSNDLLYVQEPVGSTCTTTNEWVWMLLSSLLIIFPSLIYSPVMKGKASRQPSRYILSASKSFQLFVALNALWIISALCQPSEWPNSLDVATVTFVGGKAAWPALWNLAIVVIPVQRTSQLLKLVGLSTCETVQFHRWAGNAIFFWLALHTALLTWAYICKTQNVQEFFSLMLPYKNLYTEGVVNFMGWVSLAMFLGLWLSSRPFVRVRCFEGFQILHVVFAALFILFANLHDYNTLFFIQPAFVGWVTDRILRQKSRLRTLVSVWDSDSEMGTYHDGTLTVSASATAPIVSLTFPIPTTWPDLVPGMFVYLKNMALSTRQSHPFSISSIDHNSQTFTLHVKSLGDWTDKFVERAMSLQAQTTSLDASIHEMWELEGPYGGPALAKTLEEYPQCLFIAGGIGLTGITTLAAARKHQGASSTIAWLVQTQCEVNALAPLLKRVQVSRGTTYTANPDLYIYRTQVRATTATPETNSNCSRCDEPKRSTSQAPERSLRVCYTPVKTICSSEQWAVVLAAAVGVVLSFVFARLLCCNQPSHSSATDGRHGTRQCSSPFGSSVCVSCEIGGPVDPDFPCCTLPVCHYCFRGLPVLISFILVPPWTYLISHIATTLLRLLNEYLHRVAHTHESMLDWLGRFDGYLYHSTHTHDEGVASSPTRTNTIASSERTTTMTAPSAITIPQPVLEVGPVDIGDLLTRHLVNADENHEAEMAVVVCGPPSLSQKVREEAILLNPHNLRIFTLSWDN